MPKLKTLLWLILVSAIVSSCAYFPPVKPMIQPCVVVHELNRCICSDFEGNSTYDLTWEECDGYIAISLKDSRLVDEYIMNLEKQLQEANKRRLF